MCPLVVTNYLVSVKKCVSYLCAVYVSFLSTRERERLIVKFGNKKNSKDTKMGFEGHENDGFK